MKFTSKGPLNKRLCAMMNDYNFRQHSPGSTQKHHQFIIIKTWIPYLATKKHIFQFIIFTYLPHSICTSYELVRLKIKTYQLLHWIFPVLKSIHRKRTALWQCCLKKNEHARIWNFFLIYITPRRQYLLSPTYWINSCILLVMKIKLQVLRFIFSKP